MAPPKKTTTAENDPISEFLRKHGRPDRFVAWGTSVIVQGSRGCHYEETAYQSPPPTQGPSFIPQKIKKPPKSMAVVLDKTPIASACDNSRQFSGLDTSTSGKMHYYHAYDKEDFGVDGDGPKVIGFAGNDNAQKYILDKEFALENIKVIGFAGNDNAQKYILDKEFALENIKAFAADFLEGMLKPFYKSDPIPEKNDGDVKIVVGNNFDEIVLDNSKDVLLEIYAPWSWCGHCQALEPTYNKLAKHLRGIESLVIAKMDGTTNGHPRARAEGFPTLLFFPAGNKSSDPILVETDQTVVALYKFLRKHASILFKLQKPTSTPTSEDSDAEEGTKSSSADVKDEL